MSIGLNIVIVLIYHDVGLLTEVRGRNVQNFSCHNRSVSVRAWLELAWTYLHVYRNGFAGFL